MKIRTACYIKCCLVGWSPVHSRPAVPEEMAADAVVGCLHPPPAHLHAPRLGQGEGVRVQEVTRGKTSLHEHLELCWAVTAAEEKCFVNTREIKSVLLKMPTVC